MHKRSETFASFVYIQSISSARSHQSRSSVKITHAGIVILVFWLISDSLHFFSGPSLTLLWKILESTEEASKVYLLITKQTDQWFQNTLEKSLWGKGSLAGSKMIWEGFIPGCFLSPFLAAGMEAAVGFCFLYCTAHNRDFTLLPSLPPKRGCSNHPHRMAQQARALGGCAWHAFPRDGNQWSIHSFIQILIHLTMTVWMNSIMFGAKETLMKRIDLVSALIILTAQQWNRITVKQE